MPQRQLPHNLKRSIAQDEIRTPLPAFTAGVARFLHGSFRPSIDGFDRPCFRLRVDSCTITIGTHSLENDRDLNFEDYPFQIEVEGSEAEARRIFELLRSTLKYSLLLVRDVQEKLDEFTEHEKG
jgi:hypothetical protein